MPGIAAPEESIVCPLIAAQENTATISGQTIEKQAAAKCGNYEWPETQHRFTSNCRIELDISRSRTNGGISISRLTGKAWTRPSPAVIHSAYC